MTKEILALARLKTDQAEAFTEEADRTVVEFRGNRFHSQETRLTHGFGLRAVKNGRIGFSSSTNPERLDDLVAAAAQTAVYGRQVSGWQWPGQDVASQSAKVKTFDNRVMLVPPGRMIGWGKDLIDALLARVPEMKLDLTFSRTYREVSLENSAGLDTGFVRAEFTLWVTGLLVDSGLVWIEEFVNLSDGQPPALEPLADRLERKARIAKRRAVLATGVYPVIVMPLALPSMLMPLGLGVNGKQREKGVSPLIEKQGEKVLDEKLTVVDNPLRDYGLASAPIDGEGIPRRENVLFKQGVFKGFLFDLVTGAACGSATTASASRGYAQPPAPAVSNIEILPGKASLDSAIKAIGEGLLVYGFLGGGQSNVLAGDVTMNVSFGFKIERGEIVGRVKDALIAGNLYTMLSNVEAVGSAQEDLGNYLLPFIGFRDMKVATKE